MSETPISAPDPGLEAKVRFLSQPSAYPDAPGTVELRETHMSMVFLAGERVFKLKKPVDYAVLDYSTLARRQQAVADEVRLNRRLAPEVYLGARALRRTPDGTLTLGTGGEIVDWLVEMRRLPEAETLTSRIAAGTATPEDIRRVTDRLAAFYRSLVPAAITAAQYLDRFAVEHRKTAEVLADPDFNLDGDRVARAFAAFDTAFDAARPLLTARIAESHIVEGHGDLRPDHVFLTDPPLLIDCLEFSLDLRSVDPFDEIAFLGLECALLGADWVFPTLRAGLSKALDDDPPQALVTFYWCYRALLRARLALLHLYDPVVRNPEKWRPLARRCLVLAAEAPLRTRPPEGR